VILEVTSVLAVAGFVVTLSGVLFLLETLIRRDEGAGRIWAVGFLAAMLMTLAYVLWTQTQDTWWAIAVGNGALVASTGCMWLGCRVFNGRRVRAASVLVSALALASAIAVMAEGPAGGDWAAAEWMFIALVVLAGAGAAECLTGDLLASRIAWMLAFMLAAYALYYVSRTTAFLTSGPDTALFLNGFGTIPTSFVTVGYTIVAVVSTSVLRASRASVRGYLHPTAAAAAAAGIMTAGEFSSTLAGLSERARGRSETVAVISVRVDDVDQISTAFGSEAAHAVSGAWRSGVRRHAPSNALVGEDGLGGLAVGILVGSAADARRQAAAIYRALFEDLEGVGAGVIPVIGVGVGLSDNAGYEPAELSRAAREAAGRAALSVETSVLVAEDDGADGVDAAEDDGSGIRWSGGETVSDSAHGFDPPRTGG